MLGSWQLVRFESRNVATGHVLQPLGPDPQGLILYTGDGFMSAQLAPGTDTQIAGSVAAGPLARATTPLAEPGGSVAAGPLARGTTPLAEPGGYIAYTGPFHVDEQAGIVHHEVRMATMPDLLAAPQLREVHVDRDMLTLSATLTDESGTTTHSTLTWRRAIR